MGEIKASFSLPSVKKIVPLIYGGQFILIDEKQFNWIGVLCNFQRIKFYQDFPEAGNNLMFNMILSSLVWYWNKEMDDWW
jgi:hypothetical protein